MSGNITENGENNIVFIQRDNIFTSSEIIAGSLGVKNSYITKIIDKYKCDFEDGSKLKVQIKDNMKIYLLTEEQATLLMSYLKNSEKVRKFKKELVKQFFELRTEFNKKQELAPLRLEIRRKLTDSISELPDSPHKYLKYKQYTDLVYIFAVGKTAKQKKQELGLKPSQSLINFLPAYTQEIIIKLENQVALLLDMGFSYKEIKSGLANLVSKEKIVLTEEKAMLQAI